MFTIEDVYGCSRIEFCERTGISMEDMAIRLKKEITMLEISLAKQRETYRSGGKVTDGNQRTTEKLIGVIEKKIKAKTDKVKDIENYLKGVV